MQYERETVQQHKLPKSYAASAQCRWGGDIASTPPPRNFLTCLFRREPSTCRNQHKTRERLFWSFSSSLMWSMSATMAATGRKFDFLVSCSDLLVFATLPPPPNLASARCSPSSIARGWGPFRPVTPFGSWCICLKNKRDVLWWYASLLHASVEIADEFLIASTMTFVEVKIMPWKVMAWEIVQRFVMFFKQLPEFRWENLAVPSVLYVTVQLLTFKLALRHLRPMHGSPFLVEADKYPVSGIYTCSSNRLFWASLICTFSTRPENYTLDVLCVLFIF